MRKMEAIELLSFEYRCHSSVTWDNRNSSPISLCACMKAGNHGWHLADGLWPRNHPTNSLFFVMQLEWSQNLNIEITVLQFVLGLLLFRVHMALHNEPPWLPSTTVSSPSIGLPLQEHQTKVGWLVANRRSGILWHPSRAKDYV